MAESSKEYLLSDSCSDYHDHGSDDFSDDFSDVYQHGSRQKKGNTHLFGSRAREASICTFLLISLCTNLLLTLSNVDIVNRIRCNTGPPLTPAAALSYNSIQTSIRQNTPYSSLPNISDSMRDEMWNSINIDRAVVVIDQKEVERLGLPADEAQRFIWDSTKRVYVVNAFHQLHCLKTLYWAVTDDYRNNTRNQGYEHLLHCLDALRQDVICMADDELLFSPEDPYANIGDGHIRQCKDFSKLEEWVLAPERNACYTFYEIQDGQQENEEWRHCPPDSPYFQNMRKYFGYPEGWLPDYTLHLGPTFPPVKG